MGLHRIAIFFNGSLPMRDGLAAHERAFVREMYPLILEEQKFDKVYRLDDECETRDVRDDVVCLPPTLESLERVTREITSEFVRPENEVSVFTFANGHGSSGHTIPTRAGGIAGRSFAGVLNQFPKDVSRTTLLHMCFGGGYVTFGLADENDLLIAYSGGDEVNWADASRDALLQHRLQPDEPYDPNGEGIFSMQEAFWLGQHYVYNTLAPFRRRFVFLRGRSYIDRGLGKIPAAPPFSPHLAEVQDVDSYLKLTMEGAKQGVTVIGFEGERGGESLRKMLEEAVAEEGEWTQFIWVPRHLAAEIVQPGDSKRLKKGSIYKLFYAGSDATASFEHRRDVRDVLGRLYSGKRIGKRRCPSCSD